MNILTPETVKEVRSRGGLQAIAISHPHFYTGVAAWAGEFDVPVYIHAMDRQWVTEPCDKIQLWEGTHCCCFMYLSDLEMLVMVPWVHLRYQSCACNALSCDGVVAGLHGP